LIIGVYAFPVVHFHAREQQDALHECSRMVSSALFDRPSWGANDELTQFVLAQKSSQKQFHLEYLEP
jgi:hypothetical protein